MKEMIFKKPNGKKFYYIYPEDEWFVNILYTYKKVKQPKKSYWITMKQLPDYIDFLKKNNYKQEV